MRGWAARDRKVLKGLLSRRFRLVVGSSSPVLLDRKSMLDAVGDRWVLAGYRFGSAVYAREVDGLAIFAAELEMEGTIDGKPVSGPWWMADIWRKSTLSRNWQLLDRQLARPETAKTLPEAVRALQLWR